MSELSAVAAPRPHEVSTPKRSSCNGCGAAKVKCSRDHPICRRCRELGLSCVYGLSRRTGKPSRKSIGAGPAMTGRGHVHAEQRIARREERQRTSAPLMTSLPNMVLDMHPEIHGVGGRSSNDGQDTLLAESYPSLPLDIWPQLDLLGGVLDLPSCVSTESMGNFTSTSGPQRSHSCPRESYEIFRDLICPSPSLHAPESNSTTVPTQLDLVLHVNRSAIDRLGRVLRCACAKSGHRAMVHASIVSRILIWYQQAAGLVSFSSCESRRSSVLTESPTMRSTSSTPSTYPHPSVTAAEAHADVEPSLAQATGFSVERVPVYIGTFSVDDDEIQAAFRTQLVLSELKKAAILIDVFTSPDLGGSSASGVADIYSYLGAWLRKEHSRIVGLLVSRLGIHHGLAF